MRPTGSYLVLEMGEVNFALLTSSPWYPAAISYSWAEPSGPPPSIFALICSRKMPDGKFDLTVGKLSPLLNDWQQATPWRLTDNLAGFTTSRVNGQRKYLNLMRVRHLVCQITRTNKHVGTPALANTDDRVTSDRRINNCNQSG